MLFLSLSLALADEPVERTTVMTEEFLDRVPTGRDYLSAVAQAPGASWHCTPSRGGWDWALWRKGEDGPVEGSACASPSWGVRFDQEALDRFHVRSVDDALRWTTRDYSQPVVVMVDGVRVR